uniref:Cytochrome c oxidase subunit 7A2, mitochondrial n=1 Tax=Anguilla anguilla TaxID=7936 RepID=A0A0E9XM91_ANGAN
MPIHLKGGTRDALLYRFTMVLTVLGAGYVVYELCDVAFPKKKTEPYPAFIHVKLPVLVVKYICKLSGS